jgi:hypothetical protein
MLSVSALYSIDDKMLNKYGADGGMKIGMEQQNTESLCQFHCAHHGSDITWCRAQTALVGSGRLTA